MQPLKEWINSPEVKRLKKESAGEKFGREFFRDPLRSVYLNPEVFYSPADGVVLYAIERVKADECIVKNLMFT
jgi:hypothetical protein